MEIFHLFTLILSKLAAQGIDMSVTCNSQMWQVLDKKGDMIFGTSSATDVNAFLQGYLAAAGQQTDSTVNSGF